MRAELFAVAAGRRMAVELGWFGREELKVAAGHWRRWSWYYMELLAEALAAELPLDCSSNCS
jgi:hypothetical protein